MSIAEVAGVLTAIAALVAALGALYKVWSSGRLASTKIKQDALEKLVEHLQGDIEQLQRNDGEKTKRIQQLEYEREDWIAEREHMREEIRMLRQALAAHNIAVPEIPARNHRRRRDVLA